MPGLCLRSGTMTLLRTGAVPSAAPWKCQGAKREKGGMPWFWSSHGTHAAFAAAAPGAWRLSRRGLHRRAKGSTGTREWCNANGCINLTTGSRRSSPYITSLNIHLFWIILYIYIYILMCYLHIHIHDHTWIWHTESIQMHPLKFFVVAGAGSSSWGGLGGSRCHGLKLP